jgi:hypothetical protein
MTPNPTDQDVAALVARLEEASQACQSSAWRRQDGGQELSLASIALDKAATALLASEARATALEAERDTERARADQLKREVYATQCYANDIAWHQSKQFEALSVIYEWYDRDGSVGSASAVFEQHREALRSIPAPADGRGEDDGVASASCPQEPPDGWRHLKLVLEIIAGMRHFHRRGGLGLDTHEALETWIDGLEAVAAAPGVGTGRILADATQKITQTGDRDE